MDFFSQIKIICISHIKISEITSNIRFQHMLIRSLLLILAHEIHKQQKFQKLSQGKCFENKSYPWIFIWLWCYWLYSIRVKKVISNLMKSNNFVGFHSSFHNELFLPPLLPQPKVLVRKSCAWVFCETKSEIVASLDFNGFVLLFLV